MERKSGHFSSNLKKSPENCGKTFSPYVAKKTMSICAMTTRMNIPSG